MLSGIFDHTAHMLERERKVDGMAQGTRLRRKKRPSHAEEERRQLLAGMADTRAELNRAYAGFNLQSDPDLVDSYVYEINALQSRYSYLVRRMKELEPVQPGGGGR